MVKSKLEDKMLYVAFALTMVSVFAVNRFRPKSWLPDNTVMIFAGIVLGWFLHSPSPTDLFQDMFAGLFFDWFIPPVVFAAALNRTQRTYTGFTFALVSLMFTTWLLGKWMESYFGDVGCLMKGCLLWGIVLAPTNARYAIASHEIHELEDVSTFLPQRLNAWIQSEAQLSGPLALVLFSSLMKSEGVNADAAGSVQMFAPSLLGSILLGSVFGVFASLTMHKPFGDLNETNNNSNSAYREGSLIILWAASSFFTARYLGVSSAGSLFCTGEAINRMAFDIISPEAKTAAKVASASIAAICEGFILLYLAIASTASPAFAWENVEAHLYVLFACLLARLVIAFVMMVLLGCGRGTSLVTFLVGNLTGVKSIVPFVLALKLGQRDLLSATTFVIVFSQCVIAPMFSIYLEYLKPAQAAVVMPPRAAVRQRYGGEEGYSTFA